MNLKLDKRFTKNVRGRFEAYSFDVGVLKDSHYKRAKVGSRGKGGRDVRASYAGGPVRKKSSRDSGLMISEVSKENRDRLGFNYLSKPFEERSSKIMQFTKEFFRIVRDKSQPRRLVNLLQAIVRNPILRGEYGSNSALTQKIKGFNRPMIDTAQLFKSITARAVKNSGVRRV